MFLIRIQLQLTQIDTVVPNNVLEALSNFVHKNKQLREQISREGVHFKPLSEQEFSIVQERLQNLELNYSFTNNQLTLFSPQENDNPISFLFNLMREIDETAELLWNKGIIVKNLREEQAEEGKTLLEAQGAIVTIETEEVLQPPQEVQFQPLNKTQLLALDQLTGITLKDLRTVDQELYQQVQAKAAVERKATIMANFATSSQALRDHLQTIDFSLADKPDRPIKQVIFDALDSQQVTAEVAEEAVDKILELERSGILNDPAQVDLSIGNHPLFQQELQQAAVFNLAEVVNLPDAKTEQVINLSGNIASISDEALNTLVQDDILEDQEAINLGLTASLYHIADEQLNLVTVLKNSEFESVPTGILTQVKDLVELNTEDWLQALEQANNHPPEGLDQQTYAEQLSKKATDIFPTDALITRVIPKNTDNVVPALEQLQPLFQQNTKVFGGSFDNLNADGINPEQLQAMKVAYTELQQVANQHPGLALNEVLNQPIAPAEKVSIVNERLNLVNQVYRLNPETEFLTLDYSLDSPDVADLNFGELSVDQQRLVLADFKAYQRTYALSHDVKDTQSILAAGYHSAVAVAQPC